MGKSVNTNPTKLAKILEWFHRSGVAHSAKDLEKAIPAAGGVTSMQYKDYLQALVDENKVKVEKIGSGNWYWSFAGEEKQLLQHQLEKAEEAKNKALVEVEDIKAKIEEAARARQDEQDEEDGDGLDRRSALEMQDQLRREIEELKEELAAYRDSDPQVLEDMQKEVAHLKSQTEKWTDNIYTVEQHLKKMGMDRQQIEQLKVQWYGDEYSEEDGGLKEL